MISNNKTACGLLALMLLPVAAIAQLDVSSRNSELKFNGTNFGNTDQIASDTSLSDSFDAGFSDTISHPTANGINAGSYAMSQFDIVSPTLLQTSHSAACEITSAEASPAMRLTGDFDVEFTVQSETVIVMDGVLSGSSNIAQDPFTAVVLDVTNIIGTPDLFNSLLHDFPLFATLVPGENYRLRVDARATCTQGRLSNSDTLELSLVVAADSDDDGVLNVNDNCVFVQNPDQLDTNSDGIGNLCDPDLNDDCLVNFNDLFLFQDAFFSSDPDADLDGSGSVNFADLAIMQSLFFGPPGPSGVANDCSP